MKSLMKKGRVLWLLIMMILDVVPAGAHSPTWTDGIACIIYSHCTSCHNPSGIAPFSLMSYNDVYQNRFSIAASVQARSMPPFPANQEKRQYAHANTLSQHEIDEIVDWVAGFAPLGNSSQIPTPPTYSSAYQIQSPDFVGQIPAYTITSNQDVYRMFVIPVNNVAQQSIQSVEVYPGNREIVHHALVFQDTSSIPFNLDQNDPLPGYSAFGGTGSQTSKLLTVFTPGQGAFSFAPGFGAPMLPNSFLVVQMHYPGGVVGQVDSTQVRIRYGPSNLRSVTTISALNHGLTLTNGPLFIPADSVKTFYSQVAVNSNRTLTGIMPHMHLIGRSVKAFCVPPSGDTIHLIDIPNWDFHWQYFYQFQKPVLLPAGSVVYGEATYDNTSGNPNNPNNPPQNVALGEGTGDEMFLIYFNLSTYLPGDTSIVIDTASHYTHNASCTQAAAFDEVETKLWTVFPNPTRQFLVVNGLESDFEAVLYDSGGRVALRRKLQCSESLDLHSLPAGIYYLQIRSSRGACRYFKVIRE